MNRREFIGTSLAATSLPLLGLDLSAKEEVTKVAYISPRMERYKKAEQLVGQLSPHKFFEEVIDNITSVSDSTVAWIEQRYMKWDLFIAGDLFLEICKDGTIKRLPYNKMYRIETVKRKVIAYHQSSDGPDYAVLSNPNRPTKVIQYKPEQIRHFRMRVDLETYPYGRSFEGIKREDIHELKRVEKSIDRVLRV